MSDQPRFLRIVNPETFESSKTREVKELKWVAVPNKHDSDGFSELMDHPDGMLHYCAWVLMLQVASKSGVRWLLCRGSQESAASRQETAGPSQESARRWRPHTAQSLARVTHARVEAFEAAIPRLKEIGWLEEVDSQTAGLEDVAPEKKGHRQESAGASQESAVSRLESAACRQKSTPTGQDITGQDRRVEGSGSAHTPPSDGSGGGDRRADPAVAGRPTEPAIVTPEGITRKGLSPTLEEALAYVAKAGAFQAGTEDVPFTKAQVRSAWLSLEAGKSPLGQWMWGKNPLTDWRSALLSRLDSIGGKAAASPGGAVGDRIGREKALEAARRSLAAMENRRSEDGVDRIALARLREKVAGMEAELAGI